MSSVDFFRALSEHEPLPLFREPSIFDRDEERPSVFDESALSDEAISSLSDGDPFADLDHLKALSDQVMKMALAAEGSRMLGEHSAIQQQYVRLGEIAAEGFHEALDSQLTPEAYTLIDCMPKVATRPEVENSNPIQ